MSRLFKVATKFADGKVLGIRRCTTSASSSHNIIVGGEVPGLSKNVIVVPSEEVGFPGASKKATYKNPEYFCYHNTSYFEAEVEMMKYRLPQPSPKKKKPSSTY